MIQDRALSAFRLPINKLGQSQAVVSHITSHFMPTDMYLPATQVLLLHLPPAFQSGCYFAPMTGYQYSDHAPAAGTTL